MHRTVYLILLFCWHFSFCSATGGSVDSLYHALGSSEKFNELVWLKVATETTFGELSEEEWTKFGAVFFLQEVAIQTLTDVQEKYKKPIALQVGLDFKPVLDEREILPSLAILSSIREEGLLYRYLDFFRRNCTQVGIDYIVLPGISLATPQQAVTLNTIHTYDSGFFIFSEELSLHIPQKSKEAQQLFKEKKYCLASPMDIDRLNKVEKKYARKMNFDPVQVHVKRNLRHKSAQRMPSGIRQPMSESLATDLFKASIIPFQREAGLLPLKADTICLITDSPYGEMAQMLRNYAYVYTEIDDFSNTSAPVLVDGNTTMDLSLYTDHTVIGYGSQEQMDDLSGYLDAALVTSLDIQGRAYLLAGMLFGVWPADGRVSSRLRGLADFSSAPLRSQSILGYAPAEILGLDDLHIQQIRAIANEAITSGSTPGCQVAVVKGGAIVMEEGFGHLTYDSLIEVDENTIYDLASVTKVMGTLLAIMKLYDQGLVHLDSSVSSYLPHFKASNKEQITIRQLLSHNAGLISYVPFWKRTLAADGWTLYYPEALGVNESAGSKTDPRESQILEDSLKAWIVRSPLTKFDSLPGYRYSDIGFMILHQVVEQLSGQRMEQYLHEQFYAKLGLKRLFFNPMDKGIARFEIAPTEYDGHFRDELIWGHVHDRNAAIYGGVAGHAGLFSNAHDLLVILQMMAQGGTYAGHRFLTQNTIDDFNQQYFPNNRRALGWDKNGENVNNASNKVSKLSFGHLGFTGTMVWMDPIYDLIYVFLSNRVYPNANNTKLIEKDIRSRIQDTVYDAFLSKQMKQKQSQ